VTELLIGLEIRILIGPIVADDNSKTDMNTLGKVYRWPKLAVYRQIDLVEAQNCDLQDSSGTD
jgi:hypothetical protein